MVSRRTKRRAAVVEASGLAKHYRRGAQVVRAVDGVDLTIERGTFVAITGPSGAGKSTLLHLLGALDRPTSGTVVLAGRPLQRLDDEQLAAVRRTRVGFVFQFFNLIPTLNAWENVALPRLLDGARGAAIRDRATELLEGVGLAARADHHPGELSGGEMQRVAVARALMNEPDIVLADEPTGNLDSGSGRMVLETLRGLVSGGLSVVMVTHDHAAAAACDRELVLADGHLTDATRRGES